MIRDLRVFLAQQIEVSNDGTASIVPREGGKRSTYIAKKVRHRLRYPASWPPLATGAISEQSVHVASGVAVTVSNLIRNFVFGRGRTLPNFVTV